ncbi:GNAT family N-acetyltransferase [Bacillus cytotoxicus]|uniref:GNAT family N-acetyltransferase n=1 Tax=Bacillus cytotoxicus TaxID=580165 RepID=A0ACC6A7D0_9BACI|nr:GNAT family N-acetyltransferase [Bacillus cytotoxicus]HDX9579766.1 GNAT family N-acetyltransferase [Bacillus pseudomycoides]
MKESLTIQEYSSNYQSQVLDLILSIQQDEYNIPISKEDQPDLLTIESVYQPGNGNFWIALYQGEVVGTIALLDIGNRQVALRKMFVKKEFRGKTFQTASLLLHNAIAWAKTKEVKEIYLGTTLQFVAAHRFYEKHHFENVEMDTLPINFPIMQVDKKFYKYIVS